MQLLHALNHFFETYHLIVQLLFVFQVQRPDQHFVIGLGAVLQQDGEHSPQIVLDEVGVLGHLHIVLDHLEEAKRVGEQGPVYAIDDITVNSFSYQFIFAYVVPCERHHVVGVEKAAWDLHVGGLVQRRVEPVLHNTWTKVRFLRIEVLHVFVFVAEHVVLSVIVQRPLF